jgi:hypothetical protein
MDYKEQLKHPKWQKKRLEILERDNFTCQLCKDTETTLHIHHKEYFKHKLAWEYEDEYLITMCSHCHNIIESYKKIINKNFNFYEVRCIKFKSDGFFKMFVYINEVMSILVYDPNHIKVISIPLDFNETTKFIEFISNINHGL